MASLTKDRLIFSIADLTESDNIGAYLRAGDDGDLISSTNVGGKEGVDANIINASLTVNATNLDIRDLSHVQDSVKIGDGTDFLAINADGSINTNAIVDGSYSEDSVHVSGDKGLFALAVRNDGAATTLTSANGDYSPIAVDNKGRLLVTADLTVTSDYVYAEDTAAINGDLLAAVASVRQDVLSSSVSADGDYGTFKVNSRGALWTAAVGTAADDATDSENPVKIGSRALSGALAAVSASGSRADMVSDMYRRIMINDSPNISVNSRVLTVGAFEVAFPTASPGRRRIMVQNTSSKDIYVGPTGLTISTGLQIARGATLSLEIGQNVNLFAIASSAGNDVRIFELA